MRKSLMVSAVAALTIVAAFVGMVQVQKGRQVLCVSSAQATYKPSPMGEVSMKVLWGDMDKGPHATMWVCMPASYPESNLANVVIKGAYLEE
jgi:hypothetical protein